MKKLNPDYVLAPFHKLISVCQRNVLLGLRIIEKVDNFPEPTPEELQLLQLSFGVQIGNLEVSKGVFKNWVLRNGFQDLHRGVRLAFERLFVFNSIHREMAANAGIDINLRARELVKKSSSWNYPELVKQLQQFSKEPLDLAKHAESFNNARNCLVHENGVVTQKRCNNPEQDQLIIYGRKFKIFFARPDDEEVLAEMDKQGPEHSALMLGSEEFQIAFPLGKSVDLTLTQFVDILSTLIFMRADIELRLSK